MKNEQQIKQLRLAADILETGHPFEIWIAGKWEIANRLTPEMCIQRGHEIRLALATPGDGRKVHNHDSLSAEQVGAGYRLIEAKTEKESPQNPIAEYWDNGQWFQISLVSKRYNDTDTYRLPLTTPWPETPKVDPFAELKAAHKAGKVIQCKQDRSGNWVDIPMPTWDVEIYRYRIKPDVKMAPLEASDVLPGSAFKMLSCEFETFLPIFICPGFVLIHTEKKLTVTYEELQKYWGINRSIPRTGKWDADAWELCQKPAP